MINKNGGLFYSTIIDQVPLSSVLVDKDGTTITGNVTCANNISTSSAVNSKANNNNNYSFTLRRTFARLGYGDTLPTINDYCMENEEKDGVNINDVVLCGYGINSYTMYSKISTSSDYGGKSADGTMCYCYTFYNNTDNDITFFEVGLFVNNDVNDPTHPFMTARCVNPNGWTIKARENITLIIEMDFACGKMIVNQGSRYFTSGFDTSNGQYGFKDYTGNEIRGTISLIPTGSTANAQAINSNSYATSSPYGIFARLGVGQTAVTASDYCMENEVLASEDNINSVVTCTSANLYTNRTGGGNGKWVYSYTFTNTGDSAITAYEAGLFCKHNNGKFMIGRMVNESGWTFAAGSSKVINFEIEMCGATNEMETPPVNNG